MDRSFTKTEIILLTLLAIYLVGNMVMGISIIFSPMGQFFMKKINIATASFFQLTLIVFLAGTVGSSFYAIRRLYRRMIPADKNRGMAEEFDIKRSFFWFLIRPIQGGVLSLIILSLIYAGFIGISDEETNQDPLYFQVSLGFLVGYGMHRVLPKIDQIIDILFSVNPKQEIEELRNKSSK